MLFHADPAPVPPAELAHALNRRANRLRTLGAGGESFPLLVDEAFCQVESAATKSELLHVLERLSAQQQVIVLTADESITTWARAEANHGRLGLVEPIATAAGASVRDPGTPGDNGHVAA